MTVELMMHFMIDTYRILEKGSDLLITRKRYEVAQISLRISRKQILESHV